MILRIFLYLPCCVNKIKFVSKFWLFVNKSNVSLLQFCVTIFLLRDKWKMFLRNKERFICRINENSTLYFSFKNRQDKKLRPCLINFLDKIDKNRIRGLKLVKKNYKRNTFLQNPRFLSRTFLIKSILLLSIIVTWTLKSLQNFQNFSKFRKLLLRILNQYYSTIVIQYFRDIDNTIIRTR